MKREARLIVSSMTAVIRRAGKYGYTSLNELTRKAALLLREGFEGNIMVNAYGVFMDHHKRRGELQTAREEIVISTRQENPC
jgi:hypothetical protein